MTVVKSATRAELEARKHEVLRRLELTEAGLTIKVEAGELVGDEWLAWAEIDEINYLLTRE